MKHRLALRDLALLAVSTALLIGAQVLLSSLPNIELVSLLLIVYTQVFGKKALFVIYGFTLIEGLIYGFHLWTINYMYVWLFLFFAAMLLRDLKSPLGWAFISGIFGLLFGALCSIPYFFILGINGAIAYFISGLLFDLAHCAGNFAVALLLYKPLHSVIERAYNAGRPIGEAR